MVVVKHAKRNGHEGEAQAATEALRQLPVSSRGSWWSLPTLRVEFWDLEVVPGRQREPRTLLAPGELLFKTGLRVMRGEGREKSLRTSRWSVRTSFCPYAPIEAI